MTTASYYVTQDTFKKKLKPQKQVLLYLSSILLTRSYAPEPNPGPFVAFEQLVLLWSCLLKGSNMFVLTNEVLSKKHEEKFGSPQMSQYHDKYNIGLLTVNIEFI
jgi:hypothetical protein